MDKTKLYINGYMGQKEWTEILLPSISINMKEKMMIYWLLRDIIKGIVWKTHSIENYTDIGKKKTYKLITKLQSHSL